MIFIFPKKTRATNCVCQQRGKSQSGETLKSGMGSRVAK